MRIHSVTTAGATTAIALTTVWGTRTTTTTSHLLLFTVLKNWFKKEGNNEPGRRIAMKHLLRRTLQRSALR